jgi:hypothetical protein
MIPGVEEASRPVALIDPYDITKKVALLVCIAEYDNTSLKFGHSLWNMEICKWLSI